MLPFLLHDTAHRWLLPNCNIRRLHHNIHLHVQVHQTGGNEGTPINSCMELNILYTSYAHPIYNYYIYSSVLLPTFFCVFINSVTIPGLSSKIHGSKEHEKKKESLYARHLTLLKHVGSVKFEMTE